MTNDIQWLIEQRVSTNNFDATRTLSGTQISELVRLATLAPTACNFQNWKFVAVRSHEGKERLKGVAYGQQKVVDASVTFIVCGTLAPHESLPHALQPSLDSGILDRSIVDMWTGMANGMYADNLQLQRDEAIRSASLGAMTLMLAAQGMGLGTGPMGGFDPEGVSREFGLSKLDVPAILVAVGFPSSGNLPQKPRRPISEVLMYA